MDECRQEARALTGFSRIEFPRGLAEIGDKSRGMLIDNAFRMVESSKERMSKAASADGIVQPFDRRSGPPTDLILAAPVGKPMESFDMTVRSSMALSGMRTG